MHFKCK